MHVIAPVRSLVCLLLAAPLLLLGGCDSAAPPTGGTLATRFDASARYDDLADLLRTAGLSARLDDAGPYTVFAPSNEAITALGDGLVGAVYAPEQRALLARLLLHHVVAGRIAPDDLTDGRELTTLAGTTLRVERTGPAVFVGGVPVGLTPVVDAENGLAYPAANVLLTALSTRERIALSPAMGTLRQYEARTGSLASVSGPVTVLAPIDDAFVRLGALRAGVVNSADILGRVVGAHVLPGDVALESLPDGATVTTVTGRTLTVRVRGLYRDVGGVRVLTGQKTSDGRVYVLGDVVLATLPLGDILRVNPPSSRYFQDLGLYLEATQRLGDVNAAPMTVFAPFNEVYDFRSPDVAAALAEPVNAPLRRRVALAPVVEGRWPVADLADGMELTALDGSIHLVQRQPADLPRVQGFTVGRGRTFEAANGILYLIDGLVAPDVDLFDSALLRGLTTHVRAIRLAGLETTFRSLQGTVFGLTNQAYLDDPGLIQRPNLGDMLRYHASAQSLHYTDLLGPGVTFSTLHGFPRTASTSITPTGDILLSMTGAFAVQTDGSGTPVGSIWTRQGGLFLGRSYNEAGNVYSVSSLCQLPDPVFFVCVSPPPTPSPERAPAAERVTAGAGAQR